MSDVFLTDKEREFVLGRLDRAHVELLAEQAKVILAGGMTAECCYQPGDGTWYSLILSRVAHVIGAPGGGTGGQDAQSYIGGVETYVCVHAQSERATYFQPEQDMEWVAATFHLTAGSTLAVAEFLKEVFQR